MNALMFSELKERLGSYIDGDSSNDISYLDDLVNESYLEICNVFRFDFLDTRAYLSGVSSESITIPSGTPLTVGGTSVTSTSVGFDQTDIGKLLLINGQAYRISVITGVLTVTIDRGYEGDESYSGSITMYKDVFDLPYGCEYQRIRNITDIENQRRLRMLPRDRFARNFPNPTDTGNSMYWTPFRFEYKRDPSSGVHTAEATTSTTQINFETSTLDGDYKNWIVTNVTRGSISRVTAHTVITFDGVTAIQLITMSPAIASQVATDTFYLTKNLPQVRLYPFPDDQQSYLMEYAKLPDKMVNDYDVPILPSQWHNAIFLGAALKANKFLDDSRKTDAQRDFHRIMDKMYTEYGFFEDENYEKKSIDDEGEDDRFSPYSLPISGS